MTILIMMTDKVPRTLRGEEVQESAEMGEDKLEVIFQQNKIGTSLMACEAQED